ncbi:MAG: HlyD family efflux transporter periplasmic adaptor subunit [Deltaproteobacteria bacterium]|nr:HlyD family efflux transporter periplasmic adaptor subunit [Deltaproteobacteria bacterium]NND27713.1 HlyD family efflux transporter periplasmic adaptor subunit [Myxococcales bacterium]MBT8466197.1 HlyD family efflux transporter periplasmic adaptor subunit [Deltaproteobacteria bacterium]MBT8480021.1 HlyD family efflux transporter periplasmic adaptor subunit [Deltaproteobacteria bacterium]NNK06650.1 HlyD family efflux transporter periplasmic adaptor subunit [Myxococcales bacterium]
MEQASGLRKWIRRILIALAVLAVVGLIVVAWVPNPVEVEVSEVSRGALVVTVNEDGRTRVKDRYTVSAPVIGNLARPELDAGDSIEQEQVIARLVPLPPPLLDSRTRAEAKARVDAAIAARRQAQAAVNRARFQRDFAKQESERALAVVQQGGLARSDADRAVSTYRSSQEELRSAEFGGRVAEHQLKLAQTTLMQLSGQGQDGEQMEILSPVAGQVLKVFQESEGVVQSGTPILELGDPAALEIVVDVLSQDATRISPGDSVLIERWGGKNPLRGHVRVVEPSAFTKLSALGVEEQRVNVIIDMDEDRESWQSLGDGYRVEARISVWEGEDVLRVPASAVFRSEESWAAFVVEDGEAVLRAVELGESNGIETEVLSGLEEGEPVIAYPSDSVRDGVSVEAR